MYAVDLFLMQLNAKWFTNVLISNIYICRSFIIFIRRLNFILQFKREIKKAHINLFIEFNKSFVMKFSLQFFTLISNTKLDISFILGKNNFFLQPLCNMVLSFFFIYKIFYRALSLNEIKQQFSILQDAICHLNILFFFIWCYNNITSYYNNSRNWIFFQKCCKRHCQENFSCSATHQPR